MQILSSLPHASILWYPAPPLGYLNCFEFQFFAPPSLCYCCQLFSSSQSLKWPFLSPSGRRQWYPTPVPLPGKFHGWRCLVGYSPWAHKESDTTERLPFHFIFSREYACVFVCMWEHNSVIWSFRWLVFLLENGKNINLNHFIFNRLTWWKKH